MISTYQQMVSDVCNIGYDRLCTLGDADLREIVGSLGLFKARREYLRSLERFLNELEQGGCSPIAMTNDDLIQLFSRRVKWASYKVAQCATLYAKGYHCGVVPVDSGMKDRLGPCLGLKLPRGATGHEVMRKHIEGILHRHSAEYYDLAIQTGYGKLAIPKRKPPTWWAHLVLIYFKRLYCNSRKPEECPLRAGPKIGEYVGRMCDRRVPQSGGYQYVVLEGVDKVGKTTVARELKKLGYAILHSPYNSQHVDTRTHYEDMIREASPPVVFDRTFISEITYGRAVRGSSRLSQDEFLSLIKQLSEKNCIVLYLKESQEVIEERLNASSDEDKTRLMNCLDDLRAEYDRCMKEVSAYLPVREIVPSNVSKERILGHIREVISS